MIYSTNKWLLISWIKILLSTLILVSLISENPCSAQDDVKRYEAIFDSLQDIVDTSTGTRKVDALLQLYWEIHESSVSNSSTKKQSIINKALTLSEELGYLKGEMLINFYFAGRLVACGAVHAAHPYLIKGMQLIDTVEGIDHTLYHAFSKRMLARIYQGQGHLDSALYYMKESIEEYDGLRHCKSLATCYLYLGKIFFANGRQGE